MVYNFALPPLLLHSILHGNTETLTAWAQTLTLPSNKVCFFNFTASHDGIGLRPIKGILNDEEIDELVASVKSHGGLVSYRADADGSQSPYELNCSYIDALTAPSAPDNIRIRRMLLTQATALVMPGVPGIYFHSIVGSRNYLDGVKHTGINRAINREKFHIDWLEAELATEGSVPKVILDSYKRLISIRINEEAFNPFGEFSFLNLDPRLFVVKQCSVDESESIVTIHNFSDESVTITLAKDMGDDLHDLLSPLKIDDSDRTITLVGYAMVWLKYKKGTL